MSDQILVNINKKERNENKHFVVVWHKMQPDNTFWNIIIIIIIVILLKYYYYY